ncbi:cytochrome oxidase putative small subunit CydP [Methylocaldum sp.]|uniref:cytochrome oxidase putative small subunit CydP n=1 Tax=Methylocaldum sp. TaxID=1969727 RepID=UPI002D4FA51B|nr:cytochrome oxidase putative small subunit CydP [Methylocaldum sp.]HYE34815.1 hypothetical protein [Methylocaldum sp.]
MSDCTSDFPSGRDRLRWEIALALILKIVLLSALWFAFFRHDPNAPKPAVTELFSSDRIPSVHQEKVK